MTICINQLGVCWSFGPSTGAEKAVPETWRDGLAHDSMELMEESRQRGLAIMAGLRP